MKKFDYRIGAINGIKEIEQLERSMKRRKVVKVLKNVMIALILLTCFYLAGRYDNYLLMNGYIN